MSTGTSMRLDTGEQKHVTERETAGVRTRPAARAPRLRRNRRLVLALALVILAGFLLGLGLPIHQ
ncbi:hypothetical protein GCM10027176_82100 [Actinoallomurus bryophytorum]|uniref:Uncharacterized protein n=1 Tax=Actinoallomurus bryophytorum TaxID=1490222 RepID=A0A543CC57_9ACTN|nr:hypothetical protein [Actinoallomurus bryophytorum]TQL94671.1 hypothetical protein FB559_0152 [Actinoallomurus bryophytorum]